MSPEGTRWPQVMLLRLTHGDPHGSRTRCSRGQGSRCSALNQQPSRDVRPVAQHRLQHGPRGTVSSARVLRCVFQPIVDGISG